MSDGPIRTCAGCRNRRLQRELLRVAVGRGGDVTVDPPDVRAPGRGAYVCPDVRCIDRALAGGLQRALRAQVGLPPDLRDRLVARTGTKGKDGEPEGP